MEFNNCIYGVQELYRRNSDAIIVSVEFNNCIDGIQLLYVCISEIVQKLYLWNSEFSSVKFSICGIQELYL